MFLELFKTLNKKCKKYLLKYITRLYSINISIINYIIIINVIVIILHKEIMILTPI